MATLFLQDGTTFEGESFGAEVDCSGEVVFNTGMVGYPESLTDPSYRGQILVFTYPLIGNYGVPSEELNEWGFSKYLESEALHVRGVIVAQASDHYSHHTATSSLHRWLLKLNPMEFLFLVAAHILFECQQRVLIQKMFHLGFQYLRPLILKYQ